MQDEYGCAAYKTVELDQSLGGEPVQHREVQGHETSQFLALFPSVSYAEGGVDTGFKHVDRDAFTKRLLHVKGRRNIRVIPVELSPKSMNCGDVFILDAGPDIFQWNGNGASNVEKSKALEICTKLRDQERQGKARLHFVEQGGDEKLFWEKFGVAPTKITAKGEDDEAFQKSADAKIKLFKVSNASGKLAFTTVAEGKALVPEMLDTNDVFILDTGNAGLGVYVWVGKGANNEEKVAAMKMGSDYLPKAGYPNHAPVTRISQNAEMPLFKQYFQNWIEPGALKPGQVPASGKKKFEKKAFDVKTMQTRAKQEKERMVDDGSGKLQIWRIENFEMHEVDKKMYGQFFGGDCYVLLYTYLQNSKEMHIIYFWQGLESSQDERGASALHAKNLDDKMGGEPVQVRVVQNKEPPHFYAMFKGKMVVHAGGKASGFKNRNDKDSYDTDGTRLFQVH